MNSKDKNQQKNGDKNAIDLNSFQDDDSIEIVVVQTDNKNKSKQTAKVVSNGKEVPLNSLKRFGSFISQMNDRIKSRKQTINVDFQLAPTLHTRSKVEVKNYNTIWPKNTEKQQKQLPIKKYQPSKTYNHRLSQQAKFTVPMKQTKLNTVTLDNMKNYGFDTIGIPKPGQSIYPQRKKPQPQKPIFKGVEFNLINNNKYVMTEKQRQQKKKQKQQKLRKEKEEQQRAKQEKKKRFQSIFFGGFQNTQNKKSTQKKQESQSEDEQLKNLDLLEQIQNDMIQNEGAYFETDQERLAMQRRGRFSLNEVIKPYDSSHAFPFVKAILRYDFSKDTETTNTRRIPDVFTDPQIYKNTFHYLVINESIADIQQRMKKLEKQTAEKLQIQILTTSQNSNGISELKIRQIDTKIGLVKLQNQEDQQKKENFLLKNYSMSKNRIGVITSQKNFRIKNYGIYSTGKDKNQLSFTFLCLLKTPESKQQLKDDVRVQACISQSQLQFILKMKKNRRAFFYDIEKLSTNIREYMSISNIQYSYLAPHIYNPNFIETELRTLVHADTRNCIDDVFGVLSQGFNKTQFQSIREMTLRQSGIVLLQGPPGTGKTSTLLGLLSAQYAYLKRIGDSRKIMICAPSNAAIDHITKRIRTQGLVNGQGQRIHPNVLRLGIVESEDPYITSCSLDHICQSKIVAEKNKSLRQSNMTTAQIKQKLISLKKQIKNLNQQLFKAQRQRNQNLISKLQQEIKIKNQEYIRIQGLQYSFRKQKIISRKLYHQMQKELIRQAQILIVTLSSSGSQKIQQVRNDIACLIVDEAAQATEPSLLIAFQTGVDKVMLIGDPYQLPATTLSTDSNKTLFNRSLFQRFIDAGIQPYFLNIQYRMTPMIRQFPSDKFYQKRLVDGESIFKRQTPELLKPFSFQRSVIFIDIKNGQQRVQQSSFCNQREANFITRLLKKYKLLNSEISVGIITPYQAQRKLLVRELEMLENHEVNKKINNSESNGFFRNKQNSIMINTIDSFQGQQKDLILISTVRSNDRKQIGFLMDERRINVSVSRAKHAMIIIGNGDTLGSNQIWDSYLKFIEGNKLYFQINSIQDEDRILNNLSNNKFFNFQPIRRRFYPPDQLTFDPRKIKMKEMDSQIFKKKGKNKQMIKKETQNQTAMSLQKPLILNGFSIQKQTQKIVNEGSQRIRQQNIHNPICQLQNNNSRQDIENHQFPMKKSHIPDQQDIEYQAQQLIRKKRKQQEETKEFQKYCQRLKQVQKERQNDDFYKFLFQ